MRLYSGRLQTALDDVDDARSVTGCKIEARQGITLILASPPLPPGILPGTAREFPERRNDEGAFTDFDRPRVVPLPSSRKLQRNIFAAAVPYS
jgi:hypothetical protein